MVAQLIKGLLYGINQLTKLETANAKYTAGYQLDQGLKRGKRLFEA